MAEPFWIPKRLTQEGYKTLGPGAVEEIRRRLHKRHPDDDLTAIEAAIYCGMSIRTIKRAIDAGHGPARQKNVDGTGRQALNRHTRYRKSALDAWKQSHVGFETITGKFNAFGDLANDEPWVMHGDKIAGHLFDVGDIDEAVRLLASGEVDFYTLYEALRLHWLSLDLRKIYEKQFDAIVEDAKSDIHSASQRDALDLETQEVSKPGPPNRL